MLNVKPHSGHWKRAEASGVDADDDVEDDAILLEAENIDGALDESEVFAADNESSFDLPVVNWEDGAVGLLLVEDDGDCSAD